MGSEAASLEIMDYATTHHYAYEIIEAPERLVAVVQQMISPQVQQIALVTITLTFTAQGRPGSAPQVSDATRECAHNLLQSLRLLVRKTDKVCLFNFTLYFFLRGADIQGAQIVQKRLWEALLWRIHNVPEGEVAHPRAIASGFSAFPTPSHAVEQFIEDSYDVVLRSHSGPEKLLRKTIPQHGRTAPGVAADEGLPTLARKLGIPYLSLLPRKLPARLQQLVNPQLAHELHCYPLGRERNMLSVAMLDPQNLLVLERLRQETGLDIFPVLTHPRALQAALDRLL